jgi:hypothetical protein
VALPVTLTNCPAVHFCHAVQDALLVVALNEPAAQALQMRFVTAEPAVPTNCPVPQLAQATHGLAGF